MPTSGETHLKSTIFATFGSPWLDLGSGYTAYCHVSLTDLYLRNKFHWNRKKISGWMDGCTDTDQLY